MTQISAENQGANLGHPPQSLFDIGVTFWGIELLRLRHAVLQEIRVDSYLISVHAPRAAVGSAFAAGAYLPSPFISGSALNVWSGVRSPE